MKNGAPYEIHPCIDPQMHFTTALWREEIKKGFKSMSAQSIWQRFATGLNELSEQQLDYLTDIDGKDRVAFCAVIIQQDSYRGIGLSRYIKLKDETDIAEFSVTVIDEFQNQGIGRALLAQLIESAQTNGFKVLRGFVLPSNKAMLALCKRFQATTAKDGTFIRADIAVPQSEQK